MSHDQPIMSQIHGRQMSPSKTDSPSTWLSHITHASASAAAAAARRLRLRAYTAAAQARRSK